MPYVWIEPKGIGLKIPGELGKDGTLLHDGRTFGIFAPMGLLKQREGYIEFKGPLLKSVAALNSNPDMVELFARHAGSIPRDTQFDWEYQTEKGRIHTTWKVKTQDGGDMLHGWVPHHYRTTHHNLQFSGMEYKTRRGKWWLQRNRF